MTNYSNCFILLLCFTCLSCFNGKVNTGSAKTLAATELQPMGRFMINNDQNLELVSSAAHFGFTFEGEECQVFASLPQGSGHNYLQYELDGQYQKRIRIQAGSIEPIGIKASANGRHTVWIYKATEAHTGPVMIQKITGNDLKSIQRPVAPLIEFIGNSITCGAAADTSEVPCGTGEYHDQHNAYYAYGPRVARALGVNYILSSVSGIGVYRNWNSDGPTMPQLYESTNFQSDNTYRWDFTKFTPQVVSIALGTNDFSNGDGIKKRLPFDSASFVNNYVSFVQQVKLKYPQAQIALLSSPMIRGTARELLQNCLTAVKGKVDVLYQTGKPVALYFFNPMEPHGCTGHPSVEDHAMLAKELEPFYAKLLQ